jgi:hypothetical protein
MKRESLTATLVLAVFAAAPIVTALVGQDAYAQTKPKKKGAKPADSASAAPTETAPPADTTPPAAPATSAAPETAPSASANAELPNTPPEGAAADNTVTVEDPLKTYYFVGARYRGTIIPKFLVNAFVNGGDTFYSHLVALELDIRKDGHSTMPWLGLATYGFGNTLFENNGSNGSGPEFAGNWTVVSSSLNAIYLGLDELWSVPLDEAHHWDFEYGFGVGLGVVFGTLNNTWVHTQSGTQISEGNYVPCTQADLAAMVQGCTPADHQNSQTNKVGSGPGQYYSEKAGLLGPKPILFPYIAFPDLGVRWKPVKQFQARFGIGFSLTGFWFGISGDYGLEQPEGAGEAPKGEKTKASSLPRPRGML